MVQASSTWKSQSGMEYRFFDHARTMLSCEMALHSSGATSPAFGIQLFLQHHAMHAICFDPCLKISHSRWSIEQAKMSRGECCGG
jgi:hypothetical protein